PSRLSHRSIANMLSSGRDPPPLNKLRPRSDPASTAQTPSPVPKSAPPNRIPAIPTPPHVRTKLLLSTPRSPRKTASPSRNRLPDNQKTPPPSVRYCSFLDCCFRHKKGENKWEVGEG